MIVGSPDVFAIEHEISKAYLDPSWRALGFFVLHIGGLQYGVRAPDASLLACSFDSVEGALSRQGTHTASFSAVSEGGKIADAFRDAVFAPDQEAASFFGMPQPVFHETLYARHLVWAPDGDEAFDDGSYVLRFDVGRQVRLIGFRRGDGNHHDPKTLRDVMIPADEFYGILAKWRALFLGEWASGTRVDTAKP